MIHSIDSKITFGKLFLNVFQIICFLLINNIHYYIYFVKLSLVLRSFIDKHKCLLCTCLLRFWENLHFFPNTLKMEITSRHLADTVFYKLTPTFLQLFLPSSIPSFFLLFLPSSTSPLSFPWVCFFLPSPPICFALLIIFLSFPSVLQFFLMAFNHSYVPFPLFPLFPSPILFLYLFN